MRITRIPRIAVGAFLATIAACTNATGTDSQTPVNEGEVPLLVTTRNEQAGGTATDGTNIVVPLAQWDGDDTTHMDLTAQVVSPTGAKIGGSITLGPGHGDIPVAGFDGTNYLVVFQNSPTTTPGDAYGQFISAAGAAMGTPFPISDGHDDPAIWSVVYGGGTYLVVYHRVALDLINRYARLVSPAGVVGAEIPVDANGITATAFDGTQFLMAYGRAGQIKGRFMTPSGTMGAIFVINGATGANNRSMSMAFNGTNYLVAWSELVSGGVADNWDVYIQAVSPSGTLVGSATAIASGAGDQVALNVVSAEGKFLVTWIDGDLGTRATKAQFVDGTGTTLGTPTTLLSPNPQSVAGSPAAFIAGQYVTIVNRLQGTWNVFVKAVTLTP